MSQDLLTEIGTWGTFLSAVAALVVTFVNMRMLQEMKLSREVTTKPRIVLLPNAQVRSVSYRQKAESISFDYFDQLKTEEPEKRKRLSCFEIKNVGNAPGTQCSIRWRLGAAGVDYLRAKEADWKCKFKFHSDSDGPFAVFSMAFDGSAHMFAAEQETTFPVVVASPQTDYSTPVIDVNLDRHIALMALGFGISIMDQTTDSGTPLKDVQSKFEIDLAVTYFDLYGTKYVANYAVTPQLDHASRGKDDLSVAYLVGLTPKEVLAYG